MDHGIGVVSGATTCCLPMSCARRKTIKRDRTTGRQHQPSPPALAENFRRLSGVSQAFSTLRGYDVKNLYDVVTNELLSLLGVPRTR